MLKPISLKLYNRFYRKNETEKNHTQSSSHWKNFSQKFKVDVDEAGNVNEIKGYGFGGSGNTGVLSNLVASFGNFLIRSGLSYPNLGAVISNSQKMVRKMGLSFSQDAFRQACVAGFLKTHLEKQTVVVKNILLIGDGHGILSALMSELFPDAKIFLIDLGQTLFFQSYYLGNTFPEKKHTLIGEEYEKAENGFFYCPAEDLSLFPVENFDLAINVASMQEMTMNVVDQYFQLLRERKTKFFYCCNRLEKKLPDGEIIRFMNYPWNTEDIQLVDEKCPWHQFFIGRSSAENIKLFNLIPVPLLHRYDGIHWHRLSILSH